MSMRLNGNSPDRLIYFWIPYFVPVIILIQLLKKPSLRFSMVMLALVCIAWIVESVLNSRKLGTLRIDNGIYINDTQVFPGDIIAIRKITDKGNFLSYRSLKIDLRLNNEVRTIKIMEKPITLFDLYKKRTSKTLTPLLESFQDLKNKVEDRPIETPANKYIQ